MKYNEIKTLTGAMDLDGDYPFVAPGDYGITYNCRSGGNGENNLGGLKNIPGTKLDEQISYAGFPGDIDRTLGSVEWQAEQSIIFAAYTEGLGSFIQYSLLDESITKVIFQSSKLDWDENGFVDMQIIGDYLIWTHTGQPPGAINIQDAITETAGAGAFTQEDLDFALYVPKYPPYVSYTSTTTIDGNDYNQNNLRGKQFQFIYQWVYEDGVKSVWSSISDLPVPINEEWSDGKWVDNTAVNNTLFVSVESGSSLVKQINIAVRETNIGLFVLIAQLNKSDLSISDSSTYVHSFYNTSQGIALSTKEVDKPFDSVPFEADRIAVIDKSQAIFGGHKEGYDNINSNINFSMQYYDLPVLSTSEWAMHNVEGSDIYIDFSGIDIDPAGGETYQVSDWNNWSGTPVASYVTIGADTLSNIIDELVSDMTATYTVSNVNDQLFVEDQGGNMVGVVFLSAGKNAPFKDFKSGSSYSFMPIYYDDNRRIVGMGSPETTYIPFCSENADPPDADNNYLNQIVWNIDNEPPSDATHYQWAYSRSTGPSTFLQFTMLGLDYADHISRLKLNDDVNTYNTKFEKSIISNYTFTKGDRVRFVANRASATVWSLYTTYIDKEILEVDEDGYIVVEDTDNDLFTVYGAGEDTLIEVYTPYLGVGTETNEDQTFFEFGEMWRIESDLHYGGTQNQEVPLTTINSVALRTASTIWVTCLASHGLSTGDYVTISGTTDYNGTFQITVSAVNQFYVDGVYTSSQTGTYTVPARGVFTNGDVYMKIRAMGTGVGNRVPVQAMNVSDFYDSDSVNKGRPYVYNELAELIDYKSSLRWAGRYIESSNTNKMFNCEANDYQPLTKKWGDITRIVDNGKILEVYTPRKYTSVYIGFNAAVRPDGTDFFTASDKFVGTIRESDVEYGTQHPESVIKKDNYTYFYDYNSGEICRKAYNGISPIVYKSSSWFRDKKREMLAVTNQAKVKVHLGADKYKGIYATFRDYTTADPMTAETIMFHEPSNGWKSFMNFTPEHYSRIGTQMLSFEEGQCWRHDVTSIDYGKFHGTQYEMSVNLISNIDPLIEKSYNSLALHTTHNLFNQYHSYNAAELEALWSCKSFGDIYVPASARYPLPQSSRLFATKFATKNGILRAPFMRDGNTYGLNETGTIDSFADGGGGTVIATCSAAHGKSNDDILTISGTDEYDGDYVISAAAGVVFTFTATWVATETGTWTDHRNALISGNKLRGESLMVKIQNKSTDSVVLSAVEINSTSGK